MSILKYLISYYLKLSMVTLWFLEWVTLWFLEWVKIIYEPQVLLIKPNMYWILSKWSLRRWTWKTRPNINVAKISNHVKIIDN